jgi:O-antigen/teichoic acid export membrane protein
MKVQRADVYWNYAATFMRMASAVIILPLILRLLPSEEVGLWTVMIGLNSMIYMLDFGFFKTFSRAVTYVYSGATSLQREGFTPVEPGSQISFPLLKGLLKAMSRFYGLMSLLFLLLLFTGGIWYIEHLLKGFTGDLLMARWAWFSYGILLCYQFFTYYYDAALVGRGMIKRSRQIIVFSQTIHIIVSSVLLLSGIGLISMVIGQTCATLINRYLARRAFYDNETRHKLSDVKATDWREIIRNLFNTAYKTGLAGLSWVFANRMLSLIGALYIPLTVMASYGISKQLADITLTLAIVWFGAYYPKLTGEQIRKSTHEVKRIYIKAQLIAVAIFISVAFAIIVAGAPLLKLIGSSTPLLGKTLLILLFFATMLEALTELATSVLLSRNEVPHYKAQSITAVVILLLLFGSLHFTNAGVVLLIAVPFIVQLAYQHWKWSLKLWREMDIKLSDYIAGVKSIHKSLPVFNNKKNNQ